MESSQQPDVSVVIAYFRNAATLPEQLDALAAQVDAPTFEVVVADNEHSTELGPILDGYRDRLDVRTVPAWDIRGQCHARNTAVDAAKSDRVLLCDADDIVSPHWVASLARAITEGDILATGPLRVHEINGDTEWKAYLSAGTTLDVEPHLLEPFTMMDYLPLVVGCSMAIRRPTFNRIGRLDETMLGGSEDVDLAWRAQEAGVQIRLVPEAVVDYRLRSGVRAIFRQRRAYEVSKMRLWTRSRTMGRPVRGVSFRWAAVETAKLLPQWWQLRHADYDQRYLAAFRGGAVVGNLESQIRWRLLRRPA